MEEQTIKIKPHSLQFLCNELPSLILAVIILAIAGYDDLFPKFAREITLIGLCADLFIILYLLCKYWYMKSMTYIINMEQFTYQHGIFASQKDFIELYRIVDYSEQRTFLQTLTGLKTISIYSGDKTHPRLDIKGVRNDLDLISELRIRVEFQKAKRHIHEITNT